MEPNQDANSMVDALVDALMGTSLPENFGNRATWDDPNFVPTPPAPGSGSAITPLTTRIEAIPGEAAAKVPQVTLTGFNTVRGHRLSAFGPHTVPMQMDDAGAFHAEFEMERIGSAAAEEIAKAAAPAKTRTITLTGRRPVKVREDLWPVIAEAKDETTIPGWKLLVSYKVRQHQDGRCIAYATLEVSPEDGQTKKQRGGYLLAATDTIEPTVEQLADDLGTGFGQGIKDWMIMCAEACIASLPAEDLDAPPVVEIDTTELFKAVVAKHSREEFEAYILTERGHAYLERMEGDDTAYKDEFVQEAWEAWSAARDGWTDVWSDEQIREFARSYGGAFHGPVIEHLSIAEAKFFELFRAVCRWDGAPESTEAVDDDELDCTLCDGEPIEDNHAED